MKNHPAAEAFPMMDQKRSRLDQIQARLQAIPAETAELSKQLTGILAEQASLAAELNQYQKNYDLVRITHAKREVGISTSRIRAYAKEGLKLYRDGERQTSFSKIELKAFQIKRAELKEQA